MGGPWRYQHTPAPRAPEQESLRGLAPRSGFLDPAQHLERAQPLEALEVRAEEILDDAQQLAGARQLDVVARFEQRPREEQRERRQRLGGEHDHTALARRTGVAEQPATCGREHTSLRDGLAVHGAAVEARAVAQLARELELE